MRRTISIQMPYNKHQRYHFNEILHISTLNKASSINKTFWLLNETTFYSRKGDNYNMIFLIAENNENGGITI